MRTGPSLRDLSIPGWKHLRLGHVVLDVNGTISLDGILLPGVAERLERLRQQLDVHLLSADTFGRLDTITEALAVRAVRLRSGGAEAEQKAALVRQMGPESVVAIGNGANDVAMLREAALGIAVLGPEGTATEAALAADVLAMSIQHALDLLLNPRRLLATLRR